jgi:hypothetical protein
MVLVIIMLSDDLRCSLEYTWEELFRVPSVPTKNSIFSLNFAAETPLCGQVVKLSSKLACELAAECGRCGSSFRAGPRRF